MQALTNQRSGIIMMILSAVCFSFKPIFAKLAYRHGVEPQVLLGMRMAIAIPLFWIVNYFTSGDSDICITKKDILYFILAGFVGFFLATETSFFALKYIDASVNTLIIYTYPSIVTVLSYFILKETITSRKIVALLMVLAGTSCVINVFKISSSGIDSFGAFLSFMSALFFSLYYILTKMLGKNIGSIRLTTYLLTAGGTFVIWVWHGTDIAQPIEVWGYAFGLATISTLIPFLLLGEGVRRIGASNAAIASAVGPVTTISLSYIMLGEALTFLQIIGGVLIISGVVVLGRTKSAST